VARITRKELKTDKFALEVEHTAEFFGAHQQEIVKYGGVALAVVILVAGYSWYSRHQHALREEALGKAIQVQEAPIAPPAEGRLTFPTQEAKDAEAIRVFSDLKNKYPGTDEGEIAEYYLGAIAADQGKLAEAEKHFLEVSQKGNANYASLAKLSLAQIYFSDNRAQQGEQTLRDLIAKPSMFVSKDQATISLARYLITRNPAEARKLLDPLKTAGGMVGQVAVGLYGELPQQ
jgi:predicted negative regulator of RcsB-dependent stress response